MHANLIYSFILCEFKESVMFMIIVFFFSLFVKGLQNLVMLQTSNTQKSKEKKTGKYNLVLQSMVESHISR